MLADLLLYNGRIYTMDPENPKAQAVAITGNRILCVGADTDLCPLLRPGGTAVDLAGRAVVPGLTDAHVHLGWYSMGLFRKEVELDNVPSKEEALARVRQKVRETPPGQWIRGGGWNKNIWTDTTFPTAMDLDAVAPGHPVVLEDKSHHASWVNSLALELADIRVTTQDPPGGEILRDPSGRPTGVLLETAADLVYKVIPEPDVDAMVRALREVVPKAHQLGLTGFHDPGSPIVLAALKVLHEREELDLRALVHVPADGLDAAVGLGLRSGLGDEYLRIGGLKIFADGALGPQSAHMLAPYEGMAENTGLPTLSRSELFRILERAHLSGLCVAVHAIGDAANRDALDAIANSHASTSSSQSGTLVLAPSLPHRIEHVQLLHSQDVPRLGQLGVVASMQPIHATSDMEMAEHHWGRRSDLSYAWKSVLESGAILAFGSDCPVETLDPLVGIHAAVTRRRPAGEPGPEGWIPEQRLTVAEAVYAYTMGPAQATREADIKGSLRAGKLADLVVLSRDIFAIEPMDILGTTVDLTIFDGRIVYTRGPT